MVKDDVERTEMQKQANADRMALYCAVQELVQKIQILKEKSASSASNVERQLGSEARALR